MTTITHTLHGQTYTIDTDTIGDAARDYLLTNGLRQSLADATAGLAKKLKGEGKTADEVETALVERTNAKFTSILSGEIRTGGPRGPRKTGLESLIQRVAKEFVKAAAAAKGAELPKGEAFEALVEKALAREAFATKVKAEAERRLAESASDLDDLF